MTTDNCSTQHTGTQQILHILFIFSFWNFLKFSLTESPVLPTAPQNSMVQKQRTNFNIHHVRLTNKFYSILLHCNVMNSIDVTLKFGCTSQ